VFPYPAVNDSDLLCVSYNFEFLAGVHLPTENLIFLSGSDVPRTWVFLNFAVLRWCRCDTARLYTRPCLKSVKRGNVTAARAMSDSDVFEEDTRVPRRALQDLDVQGAELQNARVVEVSSDSDSDVSSRQIFYFSKKLFDFMCTGATEVRIEQAGRKNAADRKGVLIKRVEASSRTQKLRNFVQESGAEKPSGSTYAAIKRKRNAQKRNTAIQMGKGSRDKQKVARHCGDESQSQPAPDSQIESSQQPEGSQILKHKRRRLWGTVAVPSLQGDVVAEDFAQKPDKLRNIRLACTELINEFAGELDDCIELNEHFNLDSTYDDVHALILSSVITKCTLLKTGNAFVRSVVDQRHHRFVLSCKLSDKLTGRKNERKVRCYYYYFIHICDVYVWTETQDISFPRTSN